MHPIMFPCCQHHNFDGNITFPLERQSINCENISSLEFSIKSKSQLITRNEKVTISANSKEEIGNLRTIFPVENNNTSLKTFPSCLYISEKVSPKIESLSNSKLVLSSPKSISKQANNSNSTENGKKLDFTSNRNVSNDSIENILKKVEIKRKFNASQTVTNANNESLKFPLCNIQESSTFVYSSYKESKERSMPILNQQTIANFPTNKAGKLDIYKIFPFKFNKSIETLSTDGSKLINIHRKLKPTFPCKLKQSQETFPSSMMKWNCGEFKENYQISEIKNSLQEETLKLDKALIKFPVNNKAYTNFPLYIQNDVVNINGLYFKQPTNFIEDFQQLEYLKEQQQFPTHSLDGKTWNIINNSKTQTTSRSMTHNLHKENCQKSQKDDNEHASQVHVENLAAPALTIAAANDDLRILPAMNSKNNPQSSQMANYTENIEHINDGIIIIASKERDCTPMLFEKIINSFTTNHTKNELEYFGSADGATEFATTPAMSVTSVQNTERTGSETKQGVHHTKHDLSDLCNSRVGQIVECSEVRDTLDKTVVDGGANLKRRTGSFLVKNQSSTSPAPPAPPNSLIKQSDSVALSTSHENYATSEILPNNYVLELCESCESNWPEIDQIKTTVNSHIQIKNKVDKEEEETKSQISFTETQTVKRANVLGEQVNEMTVTRLTDDEHEERDAEELKCQLNEVLEDSKNILIDDLEIDEMKFEMNSVKGALPSTASGRTLAKYDNSITGTSALTNSGINRARPLRSSIDSVATTPIRNTVVSDNINVTALNSLRTDSNLPTNSVSNRVSSSLNDNIISNSVLRRPSLNALRTSNSPSILSVDLPRYTPANDSLGLRRPNITANDRATSIDTSLDNVLSERTHLRRQRRFRPQSSKDEPEDPVERLNRLKARISASLSEVKGVLKQYSTEENTEENAAPNPSKSLSSLKENEDDENKEEGPVAFRFVKKIRRRSLFNEEEDTKNVLMKTEDKTKAAFNNKDETNKSSVDNRRNNEDLTNELDPKIRDQKLSSLTTLPSPYIKIPGEISKGNQQDTEINANKLESNTIGKSQIKTNDLATRDATPYPNKSENTEVKDDRVSEITNQEDSKTHIIEKIEKFPDPKISVEIQNIAKTLATRDVTPYPNKSENTEVNDEKVSEITNQEDSKTLIIEKREKSPDPKISIENQNIEKSPDSKFSSIAKINPHEEPIEKQQLEIDKNLYILKGDDTKGAIPKEAKIKKKLKLKNKEQSRRSSLAAVEASKIEPPVKLAVPAKIQRRPSDSEAVVKKKLITVKTTTSGIVEEVTPKPKILKVKRSLHKQPTETNNPNNTQLATTQSNNSDVYVKPTDDHHHNKSMHIEENKDALMPNATITLQQQFNGDTVSHVAKLLPTQLEIDENASLDAKSIENLQQQQATNKSTTTKLIANESNRGIDGSGTMLDNLTTVVSSKTTSEATGQINDKKSQPESFHDLLQQEASIVTPTLTNKTDLRESQTEIKEIIQNNISPSELEASSVAEKLNKQLEFTQQQQQQQQQVVASTDKLIVKKDENADIIKTNNENDYRQPSLTTAEEPTVTSASTKTISSPQISISTTQDIAEKTTTTTCTEDQTNQENMPELKLTPAPVQTAGPDSHHHKKKVIVKKIIRQTSIEKAKKLEDISQKPEDKIEIPPEKDTTNELVIEDNTEEYSEATELSEISETSASLPSEEGDAAVAVVAAIVPVKKERKIKKKVIIKRQKRRLSIGDTFFNHAEVEEPQICEVETLEKAVAYFSDEEADSQEDETKKLAQESEELKKPLKSCIMVKQYQIGDEVLFAERFKKTQVKWRRGRIKERITSISYMIDIEGKEISSHINYLKKYTGRKVNFGGKEYLEIDYEQLAEEEEKAEKLQRRSYSIWNMV